MYAEGVARQIAYRRSESFADLVNSIGIALSGKGFDDYMKTIGGRNG